MLYEISAPSKIQSTIQLPASKSISNRALIIHSLSHGVNTPSNLSDCDDTNVMIHALREMPETIDIQAAGTAMRFLTAFLSIQNETHIITGTERMQHRPIEVLVDALNTLGAHIEYMKREGYPPLRIIGQSRETWKDVIQLPGNVSSQYVSALLMIAPYLPKGLTIKLTGNVVSRPYIQMTMEIMREYGASTEWIGENLIIVSPSPYQDIPLFFWAQRSAKTIINIPHIMGKYWSIRPDNTVSQAIAVDDKNFQLFLDNMHYLEKIDESTFAFLFLLRFPKWFQVIKQKNIKFTFKSPPSVRILPLYLRWITWIIYRIKVKKYFIIKKPKKGNKNK